MTLFGDRDATELIEAFSRAFEILREAVQSIVKLIDRFGKAFRKIRVIRFPRRPRNYNSAASGVMRSIVLFKRHSAATMRFHVAATGE